MTTASVLVGQIARRLRDRPPRSLVLNDPLGETDTTVQLPAGDAQRFPTPGIRCEFGDGTDEVAITTGAADNATDILPIAIRGADGTTAVDHAKNTPILIEPRFEFAEVNAVINEVVENELWPYVWIPVETQITPNTGIDTYAAPVAGIAELTYAYQEFSGFTYPLHVELLPPEFTDDTEFPDGAILISPQHFIDTSPAFISYRAKPTLATLTPDLEALVILGVSGSLLLGEEASTVSPDRGFVQSQIKSGDRARAGSILWARFEQERARKNVSLSVREEQRIRTFLREA